MRSVSVLALLVLAAFLAVAPVFAMAASDSYVVTVTVVGHDNKTISGAVVTLYNTAGNSYQNSTDVNGVTKITVPGNGTYLVVVKSSYYILDTVEVAGDTSKTVNATSMHHVNVTSVPLAVEAKLKLEAFNYTSVPVNTNVTVYAPSSLNVTFPSEITKFPYKYKFDKVKYDGVEANETTVSLDMASDYTITAYYAKQFYMALEYWVVVLLVVVIIAALAIAWSAGARTARSMVEEYREKKRRFVRKKP